MAIVDKTHSLTIEDAFGKVAEGGSGSGSDYSIETVKNYYAEEQSITTDEYGGATMNVGDRSLYNFSNYNNGTIKIDGVEYVGSMMYYQGWHLMHFPQDCPVNSVDEGGAITFKDSVSETHTVSVYFISESVITSDNFKKAVTSVTKMYTKNYYAFCDGFTASVGYQTLYPYYQNSYGEQVSAPSNYDLAIIESVQMIQGLELCGFDLDEYGSIVITCHAASAFSIVKNQYARVKFIKFGEPFPEE